MVFTTEGLFEVAKESWPEWDLNPRPLNSVQTLYVHIYVLYIHILYSSPFHLATAQSQYLMMIGRDSGLSTLCHSCGFACQQRVLKTFPGSDYLRSEDGQSDYEISW